MPDCPSNSGVSAFQETRGYLKWQVVLNMSWRSNYTGHLEKLLAMEFGWKPTGHVRRYDGRQLVLHSLLRNYKRDA